MASNGKRRPPRPTLEIVAPNASPAEAAAIASALEQFLYDSSPAIAAEAEAPSPWARAAVLEGVGLGPQTPWGDHEPWQ